MRNIYLQALLVPILREGVGYIAGLLVSIVFLPRLRPGRNLGLHGYNSCLRVRTPSPRSVSPSDPRIPASQEKVEVEEALKHQAQNTATMQKKEAQVATLSPLPSF